MQKLLIALMTFLSLSFFSFGITNLLMYKDYFLCLSNNILLDKWVFITGTTYSIIGGLCLISLVLELLLEIEIVRIALFILGGSFTIGWTIYGTTLFLSNLICQPLYQLFLATLIAFYLIIPLSIAVLFIAS